MRTELLRGGTQGHVKGDGAIGGRERGGGCCDQCFEVKRVVLSSYPQRLIHSKVGIEELQLDRPIATGGHNRAGMDLIRPQRPALGREADRDGVGLAVVVGSHVNRLGTS